MKDWAELLRASRSSLADSRIYNSPHFPTHAKKGARLLFCDISPHCCEKNGDIDNFVRRPPMATETYLLTAH